MDSQLKSTMINLYEKLRDAHKAREFLRDEIYSTELVEIENALRQGKSIYVGKCSCEHNNKKSSENSAHLQGANCYSCLKNYLSRDRKSSQDKVDYLGWGLTGLFEQPTSEDSSASTSTDDGNQLERRVSEARHKILRKLRRKKPHVFELNYTNMKRDEILKAEIDASEFRYKDTKDADRKYVSDSPKQQKLQMSALKEYNVYGSATFDFSNETKLKERYSSTKFDFLTGVVHCYQKFLKKHPEDHYPSVSELMIKSGQNICKDEDDIVAQYYDVLYKKGGQKKILFPMKNNSYRSSMDLIPETSSLPIEKLNICKLDDVITQDDINRAKRTGILDLSSRSIVEIPTGISFLEKDFIDKKILKRSSLPTTMKRSKAVRPLIHLNLSRNKINRFYPSGISFETLTHLNLSDNCIDFLPESISNLKHLEVLDMEDNLLTTLPNAFCDLTQLKELNLSRNCLTVLPNEFGNLTKLRSIDIRWNKLSKLPDTFEDLESLANLNVAYNRINYIPIDVSMLFNLIIFDVSYNKIAQLPMLTYMPKLVMVNAMGNLIKEFPNFEKSKSLCEIRLDGNRIKRIFTSCMQDCPVVQLTLSHNKIVALPSDLYKIETLVLLDCTNNRLSSLPWSIARLKYLTCIRVEENHIQNINEDIIKSGSRKILDVLLHQLLSYEGNDVFIRDAKKELEVLYVKGDSPREPSISRETTLNLQEIQATRSFIKKRMELSTLQNDWIKIAEEFKVNLVDISKNKFRYIPANIKSLASSLKILVVRENNIKTVPDFIGRMYHLTSLDLSFNYLENLPLSMTNCRLKKLYCRRNLFTAIPKVVFMIQTLENLDFSENIIKEIDVDGLRNLRKLTYINLRKNEIKKLPSTLGFLVNIRQLDVTENLFKRPGAHILRAGTQAVLDYLKRHPDI